MLRATLPALALVLAGVVAGCSSNSQADTANVDDDAGGGSGNPSASDASASGYDSGGGGSGGQHDSGSGGGNQCVGHCTSDQDCQNSCPSLPNGVMCCDVPSGSCYGSQTPQCPTSNTTDGGNPPGY